MTDYISREALFDKSGWYNLVDGRSIHGVQDYEIASIPAADVVEVKHGEWIPVTNGRGGSECNLCHAYAPSYQSGCEYNSHYCPSCGAKMDGGAD